MINRSGNAVIIAPVVKIVILADLIFTTPSIILQPITGIWLAHFAGFKIFSGWLLYAWILYFIAAICWLPAVWIQLEMQKMAMQAVLEKRDLPPRYWRLEKVWAALGVPAFGAMIAIYFLMVSKF